MDETKLYEEYHLKVLRYIQKQVNDYHLSEDLCSDVFVKIYEKLDTFNNNKASLSTWIFTITRNRLIDYYRTRKVVVEVPENLIYETDESIINDESLEALASALEKLDDRSRKIIVMHYYENKTLKVIAEEMSISYIYAKVLHAKALEKLKKLF